MKCPECRREIGYHAPDKGQKFPIIRCPRTGRVVEITEETK